MAIRIYGRKREQIFYMRLDGGIMVALAVKPAMQLVDASWVRSRRVLVWQDMLCNGVNYKRGILAYA
jgi:hypothetical protein